jgi:hypothetical protein
VKVPHAVDRSGRGKKLGVVVPEKRLDAKELSVGAKNPQGFDGIPPVLEHALLHEWRRALRRDRPSL